MIQQLFKEWGARLKKDPICSAKLSKSSSANDVMNKNDHMLLSSILITNQKYKKEAIPSSYSFNEETYTFDEVDVLKRITPFTTNKEILYKNAAEEEEVATADRRKSA